MPRGLPNRGAKYRSDLKFLNSTSKPAVLVETVFVDSRADADAYNANFEDVCKGIAEALAGQTIGEIEPPPTEELPPPRKSCRRQPAERPTHRQRAMRATAVMSVQNSLGVKADGDFGTITDGAVRGYQAAAGLAADGIVGPKTWNALDELDSRKASGARLPQEQIDDIVEIAENSAIARYSWQRPRAWPRKATSAGIALCFALAAVRLLDGHPIALTLAQADRNDSAEDALTWYRAEFKKTLEYGQLGRRDRHAAQPVRAAARARHARVVRALLRGARYVAPPMSRRKRRKPVCIKRATTSARSATKFRCCSKHTGPTPMASCRRSTTACRPRATSLPTSARAMGPSISF